MGHLWIYNQLARQTAYDSSSLLTRKKKNTQQLCSDESAYPRRETCLSHLWNKCTYIQNENHPYSLAKTFPNTQRHIPPYSFNNNIQIHIKITPKVKQKYSNHQHIWADHSPTVLTEIWSPAAMTSALHWLANRSRHGRGSLAHEAVLGDNALAALSGHYSLLNT